VGPPLLAERRRAAEPLAAALREGRAEREQVAEPPPLAEEMLLAALAWRIGAGLEDGESLAALEPPLVEFALAPYLGPESARRLARP